MIEKRATERFQVQQDEYYVRANGSAEILGTVFDIGLCGLSFWYPPEDIMHEETDRLDIVQKDKGVILEDIPYHNCYDFEVPRSKRFSVRGVRKRGVQFESTICGLIELQHYFGIQSREAH